jgi:hypothetical protein
MRRPRLNLRAIHAEVLVAQQSAEASLLNNHPEQFSSDVRFQQPIPVLAKGGVIPDRLIGRQAHKPAKQQVVLQLLDQQPLTANRV